LMESGNARRASFRSLPLRPFSPVSFSFPHLPHDAGSTLRTSNQPSTPAIKDDTDNPIIVVFCLTAVGCILNRSD